MKTLAELVALQEEAVRKALADRSYEVASEGSECCRIIADDLTVTFDWWWRERWIVSSIEPRMVPDHPLDLSAHRQIDTDMWLRGRGGEWPERHRGDMGVKLLLDELKLVERVIGETFSDQSRIRDGLIFAAGYGQGYTDRVIVPAQAPPASFVNRLIERFRS
jgi:hypothetical protein